LTGEKESKGGRPLEKTFAVLIALAAALSGAVGYMSAEATRNANSSGVMSMKWQAEATSAYDNANQIIIHDSNLLADASVQTTLGDVHRDKVYYTIAYNLRNMTTCVEDGYLKYDGTATSRYGYSYATAWNAFITDQMANYENYRALSDRYSSEGKSSMQKAGSYLLGTVILAFGTVVAAVGVALSDRRNKLFTLGIVAIIMAVAIVYVLTLGMS
jgi:hypothetical protein